MRNILQFMDKSEVLNYKNVCKQTAIECLTELNKIEAAVMTQKGTKLVVRVAKKSKVKHIKPSDAHGCYITTMWG